MSSREYKNKRVVLWPANIDSSKSLSQGRKIPLSKAIENPSLSEIVMAARELGLDPEIEDKAYSRMWWIEKRRVAVNKLESKRKTLIKIAETIKNLRDKKVNK